MSFRPFVLHGKTWDSMGKIYQGCNANPTVGKAMAGTGGVRKMRFAFEHRGKSGSVRVIYVDFDIREKLYLLTAYPKNEKDNLSKAERNELKKLVERLEAELSNNNK